MTQEIIYAVSAGCFGAIGALTAKIAFGTYSFSEERELVFVALVGFIISNILMWWAFTKSLSAAQTTMQPLILNMGTNFILTGIIGNFFFGEIHAWLWWFGLLCVISGLKILLSIDEKIKEE